MENKKYRTACRGCHGVCQVLVSLDETGRVIRIEGDKDSPTSKGYICAKGVHAAELLYHPDRITTPLLRKGARGAGEWQPISWDEATGMIAERFSKIRNEDGAEFIAIAQGTGRPYTEFTNRIGRAIGTPNHVHPGFNCFIPRTICGNLTMGWFPHADIYELGGVKPKCLVIMGSNITTTGGADGYCGGMVARAFKDAEKTVVIDPRVTKDAKVADFHLALRPGTDCALLLGMIHTIIREKAYDEDFVNNWCAGFEQLSEHVKPFSPEWAAKITRVHAEHIETAALTIARTQPAALIWGNGVDESLSAFQTARAAYVLFALCGSLDVPGGMAEFVYPDEIRPKSTLASRDVGGWQFISQEQLAKVISDFPFCPGAHAPKFWDACISGAPYKPKAIWLVGTNPILSQTRGDLIRDALKNHLEFVVTSDFFMTPTAAVSDLVLPAQHWLEQEDIVSLNKLWCVLARRKLAQVGEARDDKDVILEVARKMGLTEAFPWPTWRAYLDWILEPSGVSLEEFMDKGILIGKMRYKKYEKQGFRTPSGKVELFSRVLASKGLPPMPVYTPPPFEQNAEFPYIFITGCKQVPFFHTEGRNMPSLRRLNPKPLAHMHPETATASGLADDDKVKISTPQGSQEFFLKLDAGMQRDVVHAEHAWWFPEEEAPDFGAFRSNVNLLFPNGPYDRHSGAEILKSYICRVDKAV